MTVKEF